MAEEIVQLSCRQCQRRKRRCDKAIPCFLCSQDGVECTPVQRKRLPRGRSGNQQLARSASLQGRVLHLEAVIQQYKQAHIPSASESDSPTQSCSSLGRNDESVAAHGRDYLPSANAPSLAKKIYIARDFWANLTDAVDGIRDVLSDVASDDEADESSTHQQWSTNATGSSTHKFLFSGQHAGTAPSGAFEISPATKHLLCEVYCDRFHPMFSLLDWSVAKSLIRINRGTNKGYATDALEVAILFGACCTLSELTRKQNGLDIEHYQKLVEAHLSHAQLLTTSSFEVLQAFLIYLAGLRAIHATAQQWSLIALAIRIATAQGLPNSVQHLNGSLVSMLKARAWYCIGILDLQSAFDRGTRPLLNAADFPISSAHIDEAIFPESVQSTSHVGSTYECDSTFSALSFKAMLAQHQISAAGYVGMEKAVSQEARQKKQLIILSQFESHIEVLSSRFGDRKTATTIQQFTLAVARESLLSMNLLVRRPLQKPSGYGKPLKDGFDILNAAIEVLQSAEFKLNSEFIKWSWFSWLKWYALAVVLAELCNRPWDEQVSQAWYIASQSYEKYALLVADTKSGLLWMPIQKLMQRTKKVHQHQIRAPADEKYSSSAYGCPDVDPLDIEAAGLINPYSRYEEQFSLEEPSFAFHEVDENGIDSWALFVNDIFDHGLESMDSKIMMNI